jgi:tRNA modification GTPase
MQMTIFALSSGVGRCGVAVIRICGPAAGRVLDRMAPPRPRARHAALRHVKDPITGEVLDQALVLWFPAPHSETGEDMAELQVHGGRAVVEGVLAGLGALEGCRPAEPGEFARRAFLNGKLDLTGVEGLADLIEADTAAQRRQALRQAEGALARLYAGWRTRLIEAMALVEAAIDFADEGDVAGDALERAGRAAAGLEREIAEHLNDARCGEILREGFHVVLAGPANAGKSSLINALARRDVAIVSDEPGTTRDVLEVRLDLEGLPILIADTAGLRAAEGKVEREGMRRTRARTRAADLVVWLFDATEPMARPADAGLETAPEASLIVAANKVDLLDGARPPAADVALSVKTGANVAALTDLIAAAARRRLGEGERLALTLVRHRRALTEALAALAAFRATRPVLELAAEDLRRAAWALGRLTGAVDVEDVLDQVFARFCIGK